MPEAGQKIYDGFSELLGVDSASDPLYLPDQALNRAVNRTFRGKINKTRPPIRELALEFESDEDKLLFQTGNVQGAHSYVKTSSFTRPGMVVSIAGTIFFVEVSGGIASVQRLFTGNDPSVMHTWFAQGQEQLYIQNGFNDPVAWNGQFLEDGAPDVRVISGALNGEAVMPIGTLMTYAHGRIVLANADNNIIISDHFNGAGIGTRRNMDNFSENTAFVGGYFSPPSELGRIGAIIPMPSLDNYYGQAEIIIACENGFCGLDISTQRELWEDTRLVFRGGGSYSPSSFTPANNDLWYRSTDGIRSLRQSRTSESREWGDTVLSREVSYWLDSDTFHLLRFCSSAYFENRLLFTTYPQTGENASGYGDNRWHNGVAVLDFDRNSTVNPDVGFGWDGIWTGIRPTELVEVTVDEHPRLFALSFDEDEINRIYEFMPSGVEGPDSYYDDEGNLATRKIKSSFITKTYTSFGGQSNVRTMKRFVGGGRSRVRWSGEMSYEISYKPDDYPCFFSLGKKTHGCGTCDGECGLDVRRKFYKDFPLQSPDPDDCLEALEKKPTSGTGFQFLMEMEGEVDVPFFSFAVIPDRDREDAECEDTEEWCNQITCCDQRTFTYNLRNG